MFWTVPITLFLGFGVASANFDFFGNMFGQQHHHQQQEPPRWGASQWGAQMDSGV